MLSVIVSTYRPNYLAALKKNIEETIGVDYELIAMDNDGDKGLCEIYNTGAKKAKYSILCFAHEDILFKSPDWGKVVTKLFKENLRLGLVGIAGSKYKSCMPSGWTVPYASHHITSCVNFIQTTIAEKSNNSVHNYYNPVNENPANVVAIDGLWFCTRKEIVLQLPFDEITFRGFHCYDLDFSLAVGQQYDVVVTYDVLIEHFSGGAFQKQWIDETFKLHKKWYNKLPVDLAGLSKFQKYEEEEKAWIHLLLTMDTNHYVHKDCYKVLWSKNVRKRITKKAFIHANFTLAKLYVTNYIRTKRSTES